MTRDEVLLLLEYHYWARDRMLAALDAATPEQLQRAVETSFGSIHGTAVHIYAADWIWYSRWTGESPTGLIAPSRFADTAALRVAWSQLETKVRALVERASDEELTRPRDYRLLNGTPGQSPLWQMVQHVVNHGSYHRGQITTLLRQVGAKPPQATDLIAFYRERAAAV